ncbi:DUF5133 domain-containing protein [Streptomyces humi]|uniref:DUF5133 domain-containing protein n=1 Tax=Streptomyces humi TaxID=1428620 RepID=UPI0006288498|nr:DUF5133 domain-containing protein [Streptomyces humi]
MLMPHPATLRRLVKEYETLLATESLADDVSVDTRLQDLTYTLCVSTGTREVSHALRVAHDYLDRAVDSAVDSVAGTAAAPGTGRRTILSPGQVARPANRAAMPQGG